LIVASCQLPVARKNNCKPIENSSKNRCNVKTNTATGYWLLLPCQRTVTFRPPVAEKLPGLSYFGDHVQIQVCDDDLVFVATGLGDDLAARVAKITLAIELADLPRFFDAYAVDRADEVSVGDRVCRLFQFPQIFREARDGGGWIEHDLRTV